ncbi:phosphoinositide-interacting protein [Rana temporaria]|uniref:phosphoinositide-interacting protein n=1 Tax=Rana temporaria TaxID=8407 RepID=UPI001AAD6159|nr:phosphoinositide-interacting protein [Rana temporaria]
MLARASPGEDGQYGCDSVSRIYSEQGGDPPTCALHWSLVTKLLLLRYDGSCPTDDMLVADLKKTTMEKTSEHIALSEYSIADISSSESKDLVTSRTESTLYSSSRSESSWNTVHRSAWDTYQKPIIIMSIGGSVFLLGIIMTTMNFLYTYAPVSKNFGPVALSIGLMVLVVGLVWVPIIRKKRKQRSASRLFNTSRQFFFHF